MCSPISRPVIFTAAWMGLPDARWMICGSAGCLVGSIIWKACLCRPIHRSVWARPLWKQPMMARSRWRGQRSWTVIPEIPLPSSFQRMWHSIIRQTGASRQGEMSVFPVGQVFILLPRWRSMGTGIPEQWKAASGWYGRRLSFRQGAPRRILGVIMRKKAAIPWAYPWTGWNVQKWR